MFDVPDAAGRVEMTVSFSPFSMTPPLEVGEIFVTSRKIGSGMEAICRDAAILLSLATQHGCPLGTIQHSLTRNEDGSPQSIMGRVVDFVVAEASKEEKQ